MYLRVLKHFVAFLFVAAFVYSAAHNDKSDKVNAHPFDESIIQQLIRELEQHTIAATAQQQYLLEKVDSKLHNLNNLLIEHQQFAAATCIESTPQLPASCADALMPHSESGMYTLQLNEPDAKPFHVYCQNDAGNGSAWTVIQRRRNNATSFYRDWHDYKYGFGNILNEYWLGLDKIHAMTLAEPHELWILLQDHDGEQRSAKYDHFAIGDESLLYAINVMGKYSGDAGDSFSGHADCKFSTRDRKNNDGRNCASLFMGGWWYHNCYHSNLNGIYYKGMSPGSNGKAMSWGQWHGVEYSLKYVHMAIRPIRKKNIQSA